MSNLFFIGFGGTGAKCAEALVYLASSGAVKASPIRLILVDPDQSNGNRDRTIAAIEAYRQARDAFEGTPFLRPVIEFDGAWSPFPEAQADVTLNSLLGVDLGGSALDRLLLQGLFSTTQRQEKRLRGGFYGDPAVGSVVFGQTALDQGGMADFKQALIQAASQAPKDTKLVLVGSAIGGTGASGVPTLARRFKTEVLVNTPVPIAAVLMLPYFTYDSPPATTEDMDMVPRARDFYYKARLALDYYEKSDFLNSVTAAYFVGEPLEFAARYEGYADSGRDQANPPDYVEVYAGLAVDHFLRGDAAGVGIVGREDSGRIDAGDWGIAESRQWLSGLTSLARIAHLINYTFSPFVDRHPNPDAQLLLSNAPWFSHFFGRSGSQTALDNPRAFSRALLLWLGSVEALGLGRASPVAVGLPDARGLIESRGGNQFALRPMSAPGLAGDIVSEAHIRLPALARRVWNRVSNPRVARQFGDRPEDRFVSSVANEVVRLSR